MHGQGDGLRSVALAGIGDVHRVLAFVKRRRGDVHREISLFINDEIAEDMAVERHGQRLVGLRRSAHEQHFARSQPDVLKRLRIFQGDGRELRGICLRRGVRLRRKHGDGRLRRGDLLRAGRAHEYFQRFRLGEVHLQTGRKGIAAIHRFPFRCGAVAVEEHFQRLGVGVPLHEQCAAHDHLADERGDALCLDLQRQHRRRLRRRQRRGSARRGFVFARAINDAHLQKLHVLHTSFRRKGAAQAGGRALELYRPGFIVDVEGRVFPIHRHVGKDAAAQARPVLRPLHGAFKHKAQYGQGRGRCGGTGPYLRGVGGLAVRRAQRDLNRRVRLRGNVHLGAEAQRAVGVLAELSLHRLAVHREAQRVRVHFARFDRDRAAEKRAFAGPGKIAGVKLHPQARLLCRSGYFRV